MTWNDVKCGLLKNLNKNSACGIEEKKYWYGFNIKTFMDFRAINIIGNTAGRKCPLLGSCHDNHWANSWSKTVHTVEITLVHPVQLLLQTIILLIGI